MDFFNKLGKKASETYKVAADKTGKVAKEAKIRMKIGELRTQISNIYKEIGEIVYQKHIREEEYDISKDIEDKCTKIDVLSDEIETHLKECLELKDKKQCPKCFTEIEKDMKFCPACGEKQEELNKEVKKAQENAQVNVKPEEKADKEDDLDEKTNLEKTVEVESDVDENHDETVEYLKEEDE